MSGIMDWALTRSCTVYPYLGRDVYDNPSFGAPVYIECAVRAKRTTKAERDSIGVELIENITIRYKDEYNDLFKRYNYVVLDRDTTSIINPVDAEAHEIKDIIMVPGDMVGSDDSYKAVI